MYRHSLTIHTILYTIFENAQYFLEYFLVLKFSCFHSTKDLLISVLVGNLFSFSFVSIEFYFVLCLLLFIQLLFFFLSLIEFHVCHVRIHTQPWSDTHYLHATNKALCIDNMGPLVTKSLCMRLIFMYVFVF